jgi:uncharacterized surface protein with fasciclin (FAS1) repeats
MVETVNGSTVSVRVDMGNVYINDSAHVVMTDLVAGNGVVHIIDACVASSSEQKAVRATRRRCTFFVCIR